MHKAVYPAAIIAPSAPQEAWGVVFPDIPGCVSGGAGQAEAFLAAIEALEGHLDALREGGHVVPGPSTLEQAQQRFAADYGQSDQPVTFVLVPAVKPGRTKRFSVTLDENVVDRIDAVAKNRSAFLEDAARAALARRELI